jgi:hypothetical protein
MNFFNFNNINTNTLASLGKSSKQKHLRKSKKVEPSLAQFPG